MDISHSSFGERRMCNLFSRVDGKSRYMTFPNTAVAIVAGAAVQFDEGGKVAIAATNKNAIGVAVAAAALSTTVTIDIIDEGSIWKATSITGTYAATYIGQQVDMTSGTSVDLGTTTNNDFTVVGGDVSANTVNVVFNQSGLSLGVVGIE